MKVDGIYRMGYVKIELTTGPICRDEGGKSAHVVMSGTRRIAF